MRSCAQYFSGQALEVNRAGVSLLFAPLKSGVIFPKDWKQIDFCDLCCVQGGLRHLGQRENIYGRRKERNLLVIKALERST